MAKSKLTEQEQFFKHFRLFIKETGNGRRLKKDGKKIRGGTVDTYIYTYKLLERFCAEKNFELKLTIVKKQRQRELETLRKYWKKFYAEFTDYLYKDLDYYDNYVGLVIKSIRTFFNYLQEDKNMNVGLFHKSFYVPKEEIPIIALTPDQMTYLINNKNLNEILPEHLHRIKDMFVFGCTVCVRVSDLLTIKHQNIVTENAASYLRLYSQKTNTFTSVKLPSYAIEIAERYKSRRATVFPPISDARFNIALKEMGRYLNYNEPIIKTREKRGVKCIIYKDPLVDQRGRMLQQ